MVAHAGKVRERCEPQEWQGVGRAKDTRLQEGLAHMNRRKN